MDFTLYFGLLIAGHTVYRLMEGVSAAQVMGTLAWQAGLAATVLVLLTWLARAYAKSILYTLTSERLVIRSGVALPMMANIPIEQITAADMRVYRDGTGDILLKPVADRKLYWVLLWPNVSAWYSRPVRPLLRGLEDPQRAADAFASVASQHYQVTAGEQTAVPVRVHTGGDPLPVG